MENDVYSLEFTEEMRGYWAQLDTNNTEIEFPQHVFKNQAQEGESKDQKLSFRLTIKIEDMDRFRVDPDLKAKAIGTVDCAALGGTLQVGDGQFNLFTKPSTAYEKSVRKEMHYWLPLANDAGERFTFFGFKAVEREEMSDGWEETTTLYSYIWKGNVQSMTNDNLLGLGVLRLDLDDFVKQMKTLEVHGGHWVGRTSALMQFLSLFAENLWEAYAPFLFGTDRSRWNDHPFPIHTTKGVHGCQVTTHPVDTGDGLTLQMQRFQKAESQEVVLLLHGLTTSTDMFIMPEHYNLVQYLLDNGYDDVWSLDWRGSGRLIYNLQPHRYTVDDIAAHDIPAALEFLRTQVSPDANIHVICHCVGSISFLTSLTAGWVDGIKSICSNSVSLTPRVGTMAKLKLFFAPGIIEYVFGYPYLSPKMPYFPGPGFGKWIFWMERLLRRECKEPACHMISFMWGWGFPAAYLHKNLSAVTHRRLYDLFGGTAVHYYRHLRKMVYKEEALSYDPKNSPLHPPLSYLDKVKDIQLPPTLFFSGDKNLIFPESNKKTVEKIKEIQPNAPVQYLSIPEYGHQDVFMGKNADQDVFPHIIDFINQHRGS